MAGRASEAAAGRATSANVTAGGATCTAPTVTADDSADSIWQQDAGVSSDVPAGACGP
jgi:hypothetical protein